MKTGFEDLVFSVTMRCYCICGGGMHITSDLDGAFEKVAEFWEIHKGFGHKPTTAAKARNMRDRLRRGTISESMKAVEAEKAGA